LNQYIVKEFRTELITNFISKENVILGRTSVTKLHVSLEEGWSAIESVDSEILYIKRIMLKCYSFFPELLVSV
jgi:hypothetical protein